MRADNLSEQIQQARARVDALNDRSSAQPQSAPLLPETFEELQAAIEELKVAEEEMRQQNEELQSAHLTIETEQQRYQELFEFAPDGYLVTNAQGIIREANAAACALLSIGARYLKGKPLANYVAEGDRAEFRRRLLKLPGDSAAHFTVTLVSRQGIATPIDISVTQGRGTTHERISLRWLVRDASDRLEAERVRMELAAAQAEREAAERSEQQLREQAVLLETLLATAPTGFAYVDRMEQFVQVNAMLAQMNGLSAEEHRGRTIAEVVGPKNWETLETLFWRAIQGETLQDQEVAFIEPDNTTSHYSVSYYPVRPGEEVLGVGIVVTDITARKAAEFALQTAYAREHRIAEVLQRSLLGAVPTDSFPGLAVATFYKAALEEAQVGGDFFDVFTLEGGKVAMVVGDVSGKGLSAAACTAEIKYALRAFLREDIEPDRALGRLNDFMCDARRQKDWGDDIFAALALAVVDPVNGETCLALAGAEPPLVLRAAGETETVETPGMLLGIEPGLSYEPFSLTLRVGDTLLIATDGLTEARRGREFLGLDGLRALAEGARGASTPQAMGERVLEGAQAFVSQAEGGSFYDDVCILIARRTE